MKKILALILVLTLVLGIGVGVSADGYTDWEEIKVKKEINLTNDGTIHPEETFSFTVDTGSYEGTVVDATIPSIGDFDITLRAGVNSGETTIDLPDFSAVGKYTYPITETEGNTAGMGYNLGAKNLVITVLNNGDGGFIRVVTVAGTDGAKIDAFQNTFSAGDLLISKEITGNYAVYDDEFEVTVVLTAPEDKGIKEGPIDLSGVVEDSGSITKNSDGTVTVKFKVTNGSNVKIANIPYGVSYAISEDSGAYEQDITGGSGTIGEESHEAKIVNNLDTEINTGINLDNLPYILVLGAATIGLVAFTLKRRVSDDK